MATEEFRELELYDLSTDIREKQNLIAQLPEVAQRMLTEAKRIKAKVEVERDQNSSKDWNTLFFLSAEERKMQRKLSMRSQRFWPTRMPKHAAVLKRWVLSC
jgi:hypothetical protein